MDSLTQVVLGAACGEAVLGRKIGNKALLLGAIGGTIPDLDVFVARFYSSEIDKTIFHRGFMHSIVFSILCSFLLCLLFHYLNRKWFPNSPITRKNWWWLWFISIFTHLILDTFTGYGTQLFLPFTDQRIALSTIAIVDLFYTIPFLFCLIFILFFKRHSHKRVWFLRVGVFVSSLYLIFTVFHTEKIKFIFEKSLEKQKISYQRYSLQPSLFTNFLWFGTAEGKNHYYCGFYSIFDSKQEFIHLVEIPKNQNARKKLSTYPDFKKLTKLANDYYFLQAQNDTVYRFSDIRYPLIQEKSYEKGGVFHYNLLINESLLQALPYSPNIEEDFFVAFWNRLKGK